MLYVYDVMQYSLYMCCMWLCKDMAGLHLNFSFKFKMYGV